MKHTVIPILAVAVLGLAAAAPSARAADGGARPEPGVRSVVGDVDLERATYRVPASDAELARESDLILGLDDHAYLPYKTSVVEWVQAELSRRGAYDGGVTGELDEATKSAIADFQRRHGLHPSGVPSPRTRAALRDGDGPASAEA